MAGRIVFLGTPETARIILARLIQAGPDGDWRVVGVVTQPDKPVGRKRIMTAPPVKEEALAYDLPFFQPSEIKDKRIGAELAELRPDLLITAAYGQFLPKDLLTLPRIKPLNVHFSLLPAYRGAAPVNWALINREAETGVTVMEMRSGLDKGPILSQASTNIEPGETADALLLRLADLGAELLVNTLPDVLDGRIEPRPQDDARASWAPALTSADGRLDLSGSSAAAEARSRGVHPWPGAWLNFNDKRLKVFDLTYDSIDHDAQPGRVIEITDQGAAIACGQGRLIIGRVQHPGKKPVSAAQAAGGAGPKVGDQLN